MLYYNHNTMEHKVRLKIVGLSYSQIQSGAYALILSQVDGPYHIPVVIGPSEAQSIAIKMEGVTPPRPLSHDLITSVFRAFGISNVEVFIYKFEDGIFYSELTLSDGERQVVLDARTSDAVAIALRTKSPIYTTKEILEQTGILLELKDENDNPIDFNEDNNDNENYTIPKLENYTIEELERSLKKMIDLEKYEEAAEISKIIKLKKNDNSEK